MVIGATTEECRVGCLWMDDGGHVIHHHLMTTPSSTDSVCKQCRGPIPAGARLCSQCNSYQDWRGKLAVSSNVLALLVALVSVTTAALPAFTKALTEPQSESLVSRPVVRGLQVDFAVTNTGDGPAVFSRAYISASTLSQIPVKLELNNPTQAFIRPGSQPLALNIVWKRDAGDAASLSSDMRKVQNKKGSEDVGFFMVEIIETDGLVKHARFPIAAYEIGEIAEAKFAACRDVEPSKNRNCSSSQGYGSDY